MIVKVHLCRFCRQRFGKCGCTLKGNMTPSDYARQPGRFDLTECMPVSDVRKAMRELAVRLEEEHLIAEDVRRLINKLTSEREAKSPDHQVQTRLRNREFRAEHVA